MISYQQVFKEIERQLQQAKTTNDVSAMRESLAAIRSLSEVALGGNHTSERVTPKVEPSQAIAQSQPQSHSLTTLEAKPLEEDDGSNGSSIFDF